MNLSKILLVLTILFISSCSNFQEKTSSLITKKEKEYVMGTDDIPLFSGLEIVEEDSSSFDTMLGNIVISKYFGVVKGSSVKKFYLDALPQLGWNVIDEKGSKVSFIREKNKLEIRFKKNYSDQNIGGVYVRFFISTAL
ncbi:MAG: hypothetical protein ACJAW3_000342 [Lentimonas sp.]|jgi:hypothetical protein